MIWPEGVEKPEAVEEYMEHPRWVKLPHGEVTVDKDQADAAFAACGQLIAELEREVERMKVCGACEHQEISAEDRGRGWVSIYEVSCECDCYFPDGEYPTENDWPKDKFAVANNHDSCHFTPSRWELAEELRA